MSQKNVHFFWNNYLKSSKS